MSEKRIKVYTKNWKFIWIRAEELELLEQVWIHRTMQAKSVHSFYERTSKTLRNSNAISNRLTKLVEEGLLIRLTKDVSLTRAKVLRYYYRLGKPGLRLLAEQQKIELDEVTRQDYRSFLNSPVPSVHTDAMSILANQIYLNCRFEIPGMTHRRGVTGKIISRSGDGKLIRENGVIPDWIFQVDNRLLCIEMDTGSQEYKKIKEKFNGYNALHQVLKEQDYQIAVLFAVLDDSIDVVKKNKRKDRNVRVQNLNELFAEYLTTSTTSSNRLADDSRLKRVYAVSAQAAIEVGKHMLSLPEWKDDQPFHNAPLKSTQESRGDT
ncbi:replication-relaxation family protein [Planomicrobium okeanokoites]|uniref:replication-relaxation family protein n=1 Tax=Planomicrobium okeanokoites TaxID=244 RepID=UPI00249275B6|nr:replication-relaxation family protein [Planomicrobium okeanokoites]